MPNTNPNYAGPKRPPVVEYLRVQLGELALDNQQFGVALSQYQVCYRDGNFWFATDAFVPSRTPRSVGIAVASGLSGETQAVWVQGIVSNAAWSGALASGSAAFVASGQGSRPTTTAPTQSGITQLVLGRALTPTALFLKPEAPGLITT